jgi:hypothetical protein
MYPLDIFIPGDNGVKPFIIFVAKEQKFNINKTRPWNKAWHTSVPKGGFVLGFPNGGLNDAVTHSYSPDDPIMSEVKSMVDSNKVLSGAMGQVGLAVDPLVTNIYQGTSARSWSGDWQIIPQSMAESAAVALLLAKLKKWAAPDRIGKGKLGMLKAPYIWGIVFGNPIIQAAMNFNDMALESYTINYFAQGYASTTWDLMPKHINLQMTFKEFGIKYREDW